MLKYAIALAITMVFCCNLRGQTARQFYDRVYYMNDSLYLKGQLWLAQRTEIEYSKDKEYGDLDAARKDVEDYLNGELTWLKNLKNTTDYEPLKTVAMDFLNFELDMLTKCMAPFEELGSNSTPDEVKAVYQNFYDTYQKEGAVLMKLASAEQEFAQKNNIPVKEQPQNGADYRR